MTDCVILLSVYINLTIFVFITFSDDNCYTTIHAATHEKGFK